MHYDEQTVDLVRQALMITLKLRVTRWLVMSPSLTVTVTVAVPLVSGTGRKVRVPVAVV